MRAVRPVVTLRVASVRPATPRTRLVRLALDGPFSYRAGQSVALGLHGQRLRRPYSIACAPEEAAQSGHLEFLVKVDASGEPGPHLAGLRRGAAVDVEGPFGRFYLPEGATERRFLFVAGGAGIAPIRAVLWHVLLARRPRAVGLLYSARTPAEFAYRGELHRLARQGRLRLLLTATREAGPSWRGARGRLDGSQLAAMIDHPATLCFLCGPPAFVAELAPLVRRLGIAPSRIRTEEW
jgi:ferredoxin-NADP reductase